MGLEAYTFEKLRGAVAQYYKPRILSFGIPDIFTNDPTFDEFKSTSKDVIDFHNGHAPCDGYQVFKKMGLEVGYLEMKDMPHVNWVADLNTEEPANNLYDIIIDPGTAEHIFNIANVFKFIIESLAVGGRIIHSSPINRINHGFYSLSPTLFDSVYRHNGFDIETLAMWSGDYFTPNVKDILAKPHTRFLGSKEINVCCVAKKLREEDFRFPTQHKYAT